MLLNLTLWAFKQIISTFTCLTHVSYNPAGPDAVIVPHPALVIRVVPLGQNVLVAQVVGPFIQNPGPTFYADRVAVAEVSVELRTVTVTLIVAALEVFVFIKHDLEKESQGTLMQRHAEIKMQVTS